MGSNLPPQRLRPGGVAGGNDQRRNLSLSQGAQEAAKRLGLTCFHAGQQVPGLVGCVACQFQIRNRGVLPVCPDCGELVWAWLDEGPPPVLDAANAPATPPPAEAAPKVEDGVALEPTVVVQENVSIEPT
jgi:hypothetical protein